MALVDHVCAALDGGDKEEREEAVLLSAFLIEKALGREPAGWDTRVLAEQVDEHSIDLLRAALVRFIERYLVRPPVAGALAALALLDDKTLAPFFRRCVEEHARAGSDTGVLYQAMNALDRVGEHVFPDRRSSLFDMDRNLKIANEYLARTKA